MTRRPREHVLEDESVAAFRDALPRGWVLRLAAPDYGIDGTVEVFDDSVATGDMFHIQIKATDSDLDSTVRRCRIPSRTARYYWRSELPVLMVRYSSATSAILTRWWHRPEPQAVCNSEPALRSFLAALACDVGVQKIFEPLTSAVTFRWASSDCWTDASVDQLVSEVRARKSAPRGNGPRPLLGFATEARDYLSGTDRPGLAWLVAVLHDPGLIRKDLNESAVTRVLEWSEAHRSDVAGLGPKNWRVAAEALRPWVDQGNLSNFDRPVSYSELQRHNRIPESEVGWWFIASPYNAWPDMGRCRCGSSAVRLLHYSREYIGDALFLGVCLGRQGATCGNIHSMMWD